MKFLCLVEKKNERMEMVVCLNLLLCPYYIRTIFFPIFCKKENIIN